MKTELTIEEKTKMEEYKDKWLRIGASVNRIDITEALEAAKALYSLSKQKIPGEHMIFASPTAAFNALKKDVELTFESFLLMKDDLIPFLAKTDYMVNVLSVDIGEHAKADIDIYIRMAKACPYIIALDEMIVLIENPTEVISENGKITALKWADGTTSSLMVDEQQLNDGLNS